MLFAFNRNPLSFSLNINRSRVVSSQTLPHYLFSFGGKDIRFLGPKCLRRFTDVKKWHDGYIEVMADYGARIEEDYIDLMPILENLYIPAHDYVKPIKKVKLNYV